MEWITVLMERLLADKRREAVVGVIAIIAPLYFTKTLFVVCFGPLDVFVGFETEKFTWLIMAVIDFIGFLATLPSRKKGRVIQWVMGLWAFEMFSLFFITLIRGYVGW